MSINLYQNCNQLQLWGVYPQDSVTQQMEALVELHDNIMFYLVIILFSVAWIMVSIIGNYITSKSSISNKYLKHGTLIEVIWIITSAVILTLIAYPSFELLYLLYLLYLIDEVTDPSLTVFLEKDHWYWSYQYPDFINDDSNRLEFDLYLAGDMFFILAESGSEANPEGEEELEPQGDTLLESESNDSDSDSSDDDSSSDDDDDESDDDEASSVTSVEDEFDSDDEDDNGPSTGGNPYQILVTTTITVTVE